MKKRNLFEELSQGFSELEQEREGKLTLKQVSVKRLPPVEVSKQEVLALRTRLNVSQAVFAAQLRVSEATLKGWESGRKVNSASATLIKLVDKNPEVLAMVAAL